MVLNRTNKLFAVFFIAVLAFSCKKWDEHTAASEDALSKNLFEQINSQQNLSKFSELLTKVGYDKLIASSKTFTVFAPTNEALANLDNSIISDTAKLKVFLGNHIATQSYYNSKISSPLRIKMVNGKFHNLTNGKIENAGITTADQYTRNGVLQVINKLLPVQNNTWDELSSNSAIPQKQKAYLMSLFRNVFDTRNAIQIGVDANTGRPIYQPGTDSVYTNMYWSTVYDLRDESKEFTLFVLTDTAWDKELAKYRTYYVTGTEDSTMNLTKLAVARDFAIQGLHTATASDTLLSKFEVAVPFDKASIVQSIKTSNGIIHIMKKMDVSPKDKFKGYIIQGENYRTTSHDRRGNTFFRDRYNPVTRKDFKDVLVFNHGVSTFNIGYRISGVPSQKYKAYWVAVNDFQAATFSQRLAIGSTASTTFPYTPVPANNFNEVLIGEFTLSSYQPFLDLFLVGAASTSAAVNPLVCDYIRLEPVF